MTQQATTEDDTTPAEWMTIPELAKRIGLSREGAYRLARRGELPGCVRLGRRYTVNYAAFREQAN